MSINRANPLQDAAENVKVAIDLAHTSDTNRAGYVVGIDFSGNPSVTSAFLSIPTIMLSFG